MSIKHTPKLRINDEPLPARKCIVVEEVGGTRLFEVKQENRRVKYYGIKQLKEHEPELVDTIETIVKCVNNHDALVEALENLIFYTSNDGVDWELIKQAIIQGRKALDFQYPSLKDIKE